MRNKERRKRMNIMGTAMHFAIEDVRHMMGMHSDNEEHAEGDGVYRAMTRDVEKRRTLERTNSDKSNFSRVGGEGNGTSTRGEKLL
jgi:hypothetical protein